MPPSTKVRKGADDYYVFLRWIGAEKRYQGYLLPGREVKGEVKRAEIATQKREQRPFGAFYVGRKSRGRDIHWAKAWEKWTL
jgi:hypothetical protein